MGIIKTKRYLPAGAIGLAMLLSGVLLWLSKIELGLGLTLAGSIVIAAFLYLSTKPETETMPDERVLRLTEKAAHHALWLVLLYVSALALVDEVWSFRLKPEQIYATTQLVGLYSWMALRYYYGRKGQA